MAVKKSDVKQQFNEYFCKRRLRSKIRGWLMTRSSHTGGRKIRKQANILCKFS